ncbi:peptidyl-prolyl cis-trans isomerase, rhodopsin-specific isozyme-like [Contarinia nasturtii]|uniref:peptidyl-prolyl cis-trans isomerase, rhodopsin-specific isozyme-like n=1 Tax=Contarinia nasturtii TaxID=265458 RepID=UPI0012D39051|nr:peptidyl-prolyl cis-trans isomerase, rhodopsin-specific isozyme-like [Contarinia nasturtii]
MIHKSAVVFLLTTIIMVQAAHFKVTSQINLDISIDNKSIGTITVGLFGDDSPKTVENFRQICLQGINGRSYNNTRFHRVIDRFIIQGGDILSGDGRGSVSIYGKYFEDENLTVDHSGPGLIGMANAAKDKNGCQFYITTMESRWLNGKHTIFGKVVNGAAYVHVIEKSATDESRRPIKDIVITKCSDQPMFSSYYYVSDNPYDLYAWIRASAIPLGFSFGVLGLFHLLIRKLDRISKASEEFEKEQKSK